MLKLESKNVVRKHSFEIEDKEEDIKFILHFEFPYLEDVDYASQKSKLLEGETLNLRATNQAYQMIRQSLVGWDMIEVDGKPFPSKDSEGVLLEENQKIIFEYVNSNFPDSIAEVFQAQQGITSKN